MTGARGARPVVFIHSSNELFGADRVLLQVVESMLSATDLIPEVWLPDDVEGARDSIETRLISIGVKTRKLPLPILRRKYLRPRCVPGLLARAVGLWWRMLRTKPTAVYCATSAAIVAAPVARLAGCGRVLVHVQEIWSGPEARILGLLARGASDVIAISEAARSSVVGIERDAIRVIINGVPDRTDPPPTGIPESDRAIHFLIASRWNDWKGHGTLLDAWDVGDNPPGVLTIVGSPPDAGSGVDVPQLVAQLRHPDSVTIIGQVDDVTPYIDEADVMLVPSDEPEPFGLVAIEAFARRRTVIGTSGGGLSEIVTSGVDGMLFANRSVDELASILARVDRSTLRTLGDRARKTYESRYSNGRFVRDFGSIWRSIESGIN